MPTTTTQTNTGGQLPPQQGNTVPEDVISDEYLQSIASKHAYDGWPFLDKAQYNQNRLDIILQEIEKMAEALQSKPEVVVIEDNGMIYINPVVVPTQAELDTLVSNMFATSVTLEQIRKAKSIEIDNDFAREFKKSILGYPHEETETWVYQLEEAKDILKGATDPTPIIDSIAAESGVTRAVLAQSVMDKSLLYKQTIGTLIGKRHRLQAQLAAIDLTSPTALQQIESIVWV